MSDPQIIDDEGERSRHPLARQFYTDYAAVFDQVEKRIAAQTELRGGDLRIFTQTLFSRLLFLRFLEIKGWLTFQGDRNYLHALHAAGRYGKKSFYNGRLRPLFFEGLTIEGRQQSDAYGCVPYLNGGLFQRSELDRRVADLPDDLFANILGAADAAGLLYRYSFTLEESTPADFNRRTAKSNAKGSGPCFRATISAEVHPSSPENGPDPGLCSSPADFKAAIDPEMLGKVFEELVTGRHETGSYYTPRVVVSFMCREALKAYLAERLLTSFSGRSAVDGEDHAIAATDYSVLSTQYSGAAGGEGISLPSPACCTQQDGRGAGGEGNPAITALVDRQDASGLQPDQAQRILAALDDLKAVDPACGSGAYLVGLLQELVLLYRSLYKAGLPGKALSLYDLKLRVIRRNLFGVDIDPCATNIARLRLWLSLAVEAVAPLPLPNLESRIETGDSLLGSDIAVQGGFDIVLANPPYVDSHTMVKNQPAYRAALAARFSTARGAWDLYVPFWERSLELLAPGGIATLITPNKWLSIGYGKALRRLSRGMLYQITDYSSFRAFKDLGVASIVVSMRKGGSEQIDVRQFSDGHVLAHRSTVPAACTAKFEKWGLLLSKHLDLLMRLIDSHRKLADACDVEEAFAVDEAYRLAPHVQEKAAIRGRRFKFINTGTIDPYVSLWGIRPTTYLKAKYKRPAIHQARFREAFPRRYEQMSSAKIIISGMRHFEAFFDETGEWVAGISTVILRNFRNAYSPLAILGILNSRLLRFFVKECFGSLGIDQGINFSRPNVSEIPMPRLSKRRQADLTETVQEIIACKRADPAAPITEKEKQVDALVYEIYGLDAEETAVVEATLADRKGRTTCEAE